MNSSPPRNRFRRHAGDTAAARAASSAPVRRIGPGLRAALALLGRAGVAIVHQWADLDARGKASVEEEVGQSCFPGAGRFDESHPGTRWRAYGRTGVACALLRRAGRCAAPVGR